MEPKRVNKLLLKRLNLGCGSDYRVDWDNWDISNYRKIDVQIDITKGKWPADDDTYDQIYCSGVLEQILTNDSLLHVMNEAWRICKKGGAFTIIVPNAKFSSAFRDPHDVRQFTEGTFNYFCSDYKEYDLYGKIYGYKPWKMQSIFTSTSKIITAVLVK